MGFNVYDNASPVDISGVIIQGAKAYGLFLQTGQARVDHIVIEDTQTKNDGTAGQGIRAQLGSELYLSQAFLNGNRDVGLGVASEGSSVTAEQVVVLDTQSRLNGTFGRGVEVISGAILTLTGAFLDGNMGLGMTIGEPGSRVTASHIVIQDSGKDGLDGRGINIQAGALLNLSHAVLNGNRYVGIIAEGVGTQVEASHTVVENTLSDVSGKGGSGMGAQDGANMVLSQVLLEQNTYLGMFALGETSEVIASNLVIQLHLRYFFF